MKFKEITKESIIKLVDIFYEKVRMNQEGLGTIFNGKIGTSDEEWKKHKIKIANFWEGMLLGGGNYSGQPLKVHLELDPFPQELFEIWLRLFEESLNQVYETQCITPILQRARMIAQRFQSVIYDQTFKTH